MRRIDRSVIARACRGLALLAGALLHGRAMPDAANAAERMLRVPMAGTAQGLATRLCLPAAAGPAPLAVINHGSPADAAERPSMRPMGCNVPVARYFLERGYAVALPLRRGYGATGGAWAETYGGCEQPDYARAGRASADDIAAVVAHLTAQPQVASGRTVIVGQSAGGWATLAYASRAPEGIAAFVNFAGGRGGGQVDGNCRPGALVAAAGEFGRSTRQPVLWIYTRNDSFFSPALSQRMAQAYNQAGGRARYELLAPFGDDGHALFFAPDGAGRWRPILDRWLEWAGAGAKR